jgi:hypothetical protein
MVESDFGGAEGATGTKRLRRNGRMARRARNIAKEYKPTGDVLSRL